MKKLSKVISFLMAIPMFITAFASCGKQASSSEQQDFNNIYTGIDLEKQLGYFVKNGGSDYKILIPEESTAVDRQAAKEVVEFTYKATGVNLDIVTDQQYSANEKYLSIGKTDLWEEANFKTDYESLNGDGFILKTIGNNVVLDAGTTRGFLYGTYDFIERVLGIRFFAEDETYIPKNSVIPLYEMDIKSVPAFKMRVFLNAPTFLMYTDMEYIAHSRTMYDWLDIPEEYGGSAPVFRRGNNTHNARFWVPADKYGDASIGYSGEFLTEEEGYDPHPELWYIKPGSTPQYDVGGEGSGITLNWLNGIAEDGTLDETMEVSTAKVVIEEMKKEVLANPTAEYFVIDQEDIGMIVDPQDPTVAKYTAAGVLVRFCNVVAKTLQEWANEELNGRKIKLVTFAYQQTQNAPVVTKNGKYEPIDETVVPADNLYIRMAYTSSQYFPYNDERQPTEVKVTLSKWAAICKHFWFWGYDSNYNDFMTYNPSLGMAKGTVEYMKNAGIDYMLMQSSHNNTNDWQANLKGYVWSKLMWDPNLDVNMLVNEYLEAYYGPAASYVKEFMYMYDTFTATYMLNEDGPEVWHWAYSSVFRKGETGTYLTPQIVEQGISYIEQAKMAVEEDSRLMDSVKSKILKRLASVEYTAKWMKLYDFDIFYPLVDARQKIELAQELLRLKESAGLRMMSENTGIDWYLSSNYGVL